MVQASRVALSYYGYYIFPRYPAYSELRSRATPHVDSTHCTFESKATQTIWTAIHPQALSPIGRRSLKTTVSFTTVMTRWSICYLRYCVLEYTVMLDNA